MKRLWLDDVRPNPFIGEDWLIAKNYDQAVKILEENDIYVAYLDHDLGYWNIDDIFDYENIVLKDGYDDEEKTGYDLVKWMEANNRFPTKMCYVHSANIVGAKRMCHVLSDHYHTEDFMNHYYPYTKMIK